MPFDLTVSEADLAASDRWWASLSINQMKQYSAQYHTLHWATLGKRWVHQIWEKEGKPEPQELIPVN